MTFTVALKGNVFSNSITRKHFLSEAAREELRVEQLLTALTKESSSNWKAGHRRML